MTEQTAVTCDSCGAGMEWERGVELRCPNGCTALPTPPSPPLTGTAVLCIRGSCETVDLEELAR